MEALLGRVCAQPPPGIKVTGSNGKGSTCAMIASVLHSHGLKCGLFTSPHLYSLTERIQIDGLAVTEPTLTGVLVRVMEAAELTAPGEFAAFEILTAAAAVYFAQQEVDVVVWEAGIGGRLDATRLLPATVSAVVNVDAEHTHLLGRQLSEIAVDKARLADHGSQLVLGPLAPELVAAIAHAHPDLDLHPSGAPINPASLLGSHQHENAACAREAARLWLGPNDFREKKCALGLAQTFWPLRMEELSREPLVMVDVAHNVSGLRRVKDAMDERVGHTRWALLFGASNDRPYAAMLDTVASDAAQLFLTAAEHKGVDAQRLAESFNGSAVVIPPVAQAVAEATDWASRHKTALLITGGLFLATEAACSLRGKDASSLCFL
jgi:dihydrofolate synthase/folylpolyglutamate synthase